jgi:ABC-type Fe3+-hydroxamate transport system substrate-binding protein
VRKAIFGILAVIFVSGAAQVTVVDQAGRKVVVPEHPEHIASAFGVATAYLYPLIGGERIVAARYLGIPDHPLSRAVMSHIDPGYDAKALGGEVTAEELLAKGADLVFAGLKHQDLAKFLRKSAFPRS